MGFKLDKNLSLDVYNDSKHEASEVKEREDIVVLLENMSTRRVSPKSNISALLSNKNKSADQLDQSQPEVLFHKNTIPSSTDDFERENDSSIQLHFGSIQCDITIPKRTKSAPPVAPNQEIEEQKKILTNANEMIQKAEELNNEKKMENVDISINDNTIQKSGLGYNLELRQINPYMHQQFYNFNSYKQPSFGYSSMYRIPISPAQPLFIPHSSTGSNTSSTGVVQPPRVSKAIPIVDPNTGQTIDLKNVVKKSVNQPVIIVESQPLTINDEDSTSINKDETDIEITETIQEMNILDQIKAEDDQDWGKDDEEEDESAQKLVKFGQKIRYPVNCVGNKAFTDDFVWRYDFDFMLQFKKYCTGKPELKVDISSFHKKSSLGNRSEYAYNRNRNMALACHERLLKEAKGILNKMTEENFAKLYQKFLDLEILSSEPVMVGAIELIFDKAIEEPSFANMYAKLCLKIVMAEINIRKSQNNDKEQKLTSIFRTLILSKCELEYNMKKRWSQERLQKLATQAPKPSLELTEEDYAQIKLKRRVLGNVRFIGELFKVTLLSSNIMYRVIQELLSNYQNPEEEEIESLCRLMITIGQFLDTVESKDKWDEFVSKMSELSKNSKLSTRIKFMVLDVLDLRRQDWKKNSINNSAKPSLKVRTIEARQSATIVEKGIKTNQNYYSTSSQSYLINAEKSLENGRKPSIAQNKFDALDNIEPSKSEIPRTKIDNLKKLKSLVEEGVESGDWADLKKFVQEESIESLEPPFEEILLFSAEKGLTFFKKSCNALLDINKRIGNSTHLFTAILSIIFRINDIKSDIPLIQKLLQYYLDYLIQKDFICLEDVINVVGKHAEMIGILFGIFDHVNDKRERCFKMIEGLKPEFKEKFFRIVEENIKTSMDDWFVCRLLEYKLAKYECEPNNIKNLHCVVAEFKDYPNASNHIRIVSNFMIKHFYKKNSGFSDLHMDVIFSVISPFAAYQENWSLILLEEALFVFFTTDKDFLRELIASMFKTEYLDKSTYSSWKLGNSKTKQEYICFIEEITTGK